MGKSYIWYICLIGFLCLGFSSTGILQIVGSNYDISERSEGGEYTTVYSSRVSGSTDSGGWGGYGYDAGYSTVSQLIPRLEDNGNTGSQAEATDALQGITSRVTVHRGATKERISRYISYKEATYSPHAVANKIPNIPTEKQLIAMRNLGIIFFDPLREYYGVPIYINSFFRSKELNQLVKGTIFSDHMCNKGVAALDIDMDGHKGPSNNTLFHHILGNHRFYKLIAEFPVKGKIKWVHISISLNDVQNGERNVYIATYSGKRTVYLPYRGNERLINR